MKCIFCGCEDSDLVTCYSFHGLARGVLRNINEWYCKKCKKSWDDGPKELPIVKETPKEEPKEKPVAPSADMDRMTKASLAGM